MATPKLTAAGRELYYKNLAGQANLNFTTIKVGSGVATDIESLTALVSPKMTAAASATLKTDFVEISCKIDNSGLTEGFNWTEAGIFAQNPDDPDNRAADILYCYHDTSDAPAPVKPASEETFTRYYTVPVIVGNMATVNAILSDAAGLTQLDLDAHNTSPTAHENRFKQYIPTTEKAANGGVATLDENGKLEESQRPPSTKEVYGFANLDAFPKTGVEETIYVDREKDKTYRWDGTTKKYAPIGSSLELGETAETAGRGDYTKAAYTHAQETGNPHGTKIGDISDFAVFSAGSTAPTDTKLFWIDTGDGSILKYHNGTDWVPVGWSWG